MRQLLVVFGLAALLNAGAPLPEIVIRNLEPGAQSRRPVTVHMELARGEFAACAQAVIAGTGVMTQNDVRTRWPDGSLRGVDLSFVVDVLPPGGTLAVRFVPSTACNNAGALSKDDLLADNALWNAALGAEIRTANGAALQSANLLSMLAAWSGVDGGANGLSTRYWRKGPVVTQLIVEDRSPARVHDFGWKYVAGTWGADLANRSLHPIFTVTVWPEQAYVRIEAILENSWTTALQDQVYDLDIRIGNPLGAAPPPVTVWGEPSLLPRASVQHYAKTRWHKVFWSGGAPGEIKIDLNYAYMIYSRSIPNYDRSKIPADDEITVNEPNSWSTLIVARRDIGGQGNTNKAMTSTGQTESDWIGILPAWGVKYLATMSSPATANQMLPKIFGNADVSGHVPWHLRESNSDAARKFCGSSCGAEWRDAPAFGRIISLDARPTWRSTTTTSTLAADLLTPVATLSGTSSACAGCTSGHGWTIDLAHQPGHTYIAYLLTGDWYYVEEMQFASAHNLAEGNAGTNCSFCRNERAGYLYAGGSTRGRTWALRTLAQVVATAIAGSPERQYFETKFNNTVAALEGRLDIRDGAFYNTPQWQFAKTYLRDRTSPLFVIDWDTSDLPRSFSVTDASNTSPIAITTAAPHTLVDGEYVYIKNITGNTAANGAWAISGVTSTGFLLQGTSGNSAYTGGGTVYARPSNNDLDIRYAYGPGAPWQINFFTATMAYIERLGFQQVHPLRRAIARWTLNAILNPAVSDPRLYAGGYKNPHIRIADLNYVQSWTEYNNGFTAAYKASELAAWDTRAAGASGYPHIAKAALAGTYWLSDGAYMGKKAWQWAVDNVPMQSNLQRNPKWAITPEVDPVRNIRVQAGDTFAVIHYTAPVPGEACTVDGLSDGGSFSRQRQFVRTGLAPATQTSMTVACPSDPYGSTLVAVATRAAFSGTSTYVLRLGPGSPDAWVDYGPTASLGQTTGSACAAGCTITLPDLARGLWYYRIRRGASAVSEITAIPVY